MLGPSTPFQRLGWCMNAWAGTKSSYLWVCAIFSVLFFFGRSSQKLKQNISTQQHTHIACTLLLCTEFYYVPEKPVS